MNREAELVFRDLRQGRPRALSRAISWVENEAPQAAPLLEKIYAEAPHPWVIGITGVGGAGKSSLVPHLARRLADAGSRVAVLAVDPSSPLTGGALLGDRIRDNGGEQHARVFFRSVATRGGQGGLATCVADLVRVAAAAGHDTVLIETVGAGQSELGILHVAHSVLLVHAPGLGDDVQAQKAGVMEIASVLVVNKADRPGAEQAVASLRQALALSERDAHMAEGVNLLADGSQHWHPPVLSTVALSATGVPELCDTLVQHRAVLQRQGRYDELNRRHDLRRMQGYFGEVVQRRLAARIAALGLLPQLEAALARGDSDPLGAARALADAVLPAVPTPSTPPPAQTTTGDFPMNAIRWAARHLRGMLPLTAAALVAAAPLAAWAQAGYPNRPVRIIVPFSAGSGTDILARLTAEHLTRSLGQAFVVENRQGADGILGTDQIAKATPDGYTLGFIPSSPIVMNPALYAKLPFDPIKDLIPVSNMALVGCVVGVQPDMPVKNVQELIAHAKANPGKLNYAAGSTFTHLAGEMFKHLSGTNMQAIPYKGTAPQVTAMLGKEVDVIFDPFLGVQHIKSGRIRPLAVTSSRRSSVFPDLPTLQEAGLKDYTVETWIALFAPGGTPKPIVDTLHAEMAKILAAPAVRARMAELSYEPLAETQDQFSQRIVADTARWAKTVKDANFQVNK